MTIEFCDRCLKTLNDEKYTIPLSRFTRYGGNDLMVEDDEVTLCKDCAKDFVKAMCDYAHGKDIPRTRGINIELPF